MKLTNENFIMLMVFVMFTVNIATSVFIALMVKLLFGEIKRLVSNTEVTNNMLSKQFSELSRFNTLRLNRVSVRVSELLRRFSKVELFLENRMGYKNTEKNSVFAEPSQEELEKI
jgi:hypothetical protein